MSKEILLVVDAVSNEKGVSKDVIFGALEAALASLEGVESDTGGGAVVTASGMGATAIVGENVQRIPVADSSRAVTRASCSISSGLRVAPRPMLCGRMTEFPSK